MILACDIMELRGASYLNNDFDNQIIHEVPVSQDRIHWHEAFYGVLQIELRNYKDILKYMNEYLLSKEALKMDVLIIKKEKDVEIKKNIGRIFKTYNIFEYKSETDYLSVHDYYKVLGYALIYASFEKVYIEDVTVSFVVTKHPRELFKYLENVRMLKINRVEDGVYYVIGDIISIQILESKNLPSKDNLFLKTLGSNISQDDVINILKELEKYGDINDKDKYIETMMLANKKTFEEVLDMSAVVKELFMEAATRNGWIKEQVDEERITIALKMLKRGTPVEVVSEDTGLDEATIINLKKN